MFCPKDLQDNRQRLPATRFGVGKAALGNFHRRQPLEAHGEEGMLPAPELLDQGHGLGGVDVGLGIAGLIQGDRGQGVQHRGRVRMLLADRAFHQRHRLLRVALRLVESHPICASIDAVVQCGIRRG